MSRISVLGAGYVGLTTAACFAHLGHDVSAFDVDESRVALLSSGEVPIHEPGLAGLLREGLDGGRLQFSSELSSSVSSAEFCFLCVPTPTGPDGEADLGAVTAAIKAAGPYLPGRAVVVTKSTVPVHSACLVETALDRPDCRVVANPEFLREGSAVGDFLHPERVVIGADDDDTARRVAGLYLHVVAPVLVTDRTSAELVKYASNAFLAMKLSYANSLAALCEAVGADAAAVLEGAAFDRRIGPDFLRPGPGWGGSCLPKDSAALVAMARAAGCRLLLVEAAVAVNEDQHARMLDKALGLLDGDVAGRRVAMLGLAFKAGTGDTRCSPALELARRLTERGATLRGWDPLAERVGSELDRAGDPYSACEGADLVVVGTEWEELVALDLSKLAQIVRRPALLDTRSVLDPAAARAAGFVIETVLHR